MKTWAVGNNLVEVDENGVGFDVQVGGQWVNRMNLPLGPEAEREVRRWLRFAAAPSIEAAAEAALGGAS